MEKTGGTIANATGKAQENFIENRIISEGYVFVDKAKFLAATSTLDQPVYTKQAFVGQSIFGTEMYCDFHLFHPEKHPDGLIIESKWQQSVGSVDEKYPYLVLNIKTKYPAKTIIILDGRGYKPKAKIWLRSQIGNNLIAVFDMSEFQVWANKGGL